MDSLWVGGMIVVAHHYRMRGGRKPRRRGVVVGMADTMRLTSYGERVARRMAMSPEDEQAALPAALVEASEDDD